ncbi:MAG: CTP-dependent riboflavin kinase [Candidatus Aenigmarchaeota archaeon]|nr:CTP-dependent riboflavin kinase [Candidatus Aenigmarchaeota archaeon]
MDNFEYLEILIELAQITIHERQIVVSTEFLSSKLNVSQQTISRKLKDMESFGLIEKNVVLNGQKITILSKGNDILNQTYQILKTINQKVSYGISFGGHLIDGSGEGRHYMSLEGYLKQFEKNLNYMPYPGTLNLKLRSIDDIKERSKLETLERFLINGFKSKDREYGDIFCYRCKIDDKYEGAIIVPKRTHHEFDVIELIAPVCLRNALSLKNNDYVEIDVII